EAGDQPVDAGLGPEVEGSLHFLEGGADPGFAQPAIDEHQEFVLLAGEHGPSPSPWPANPEQNEKSASVLVWFLWIVKPATQARLWQPGAAGRKCSDSARATRKPDDLDLAP